MNTPSRRAVLGAGLAVAGTGLLAACGGGDPGASSSGANGRQPDAGTLVSPGGPQVRAADARRRADGRTQAVALTATAGPVDLGGGRTVTTWTFNGRLPGPEIRLTAGDTLAARLANHLPAPTSVHWHGLALRNDMDGVPPVTQRAVAPGAGLDYRFVADTPGTYWLHPHVGVQLDRGLYAPLIVEDPHEPLRYDDEWVVVLDDWLDGVTGTPDQVLAELGKGMGGTGSSGSGSGGMGGMGGMSGMDMSGGSATTGVSGTAGGGSGGSFMLMGATSPLLGGDAGDVDYPLHLVNGRVPDDPEVRRAKPGTRLRIRLVNAGADTAFRVALGGHRLTVTHTDGYPVAATQVDALMLGPGERYDVLVTLGDGVFPLAALAEGKGRSARALVRTGSGAAPATGVRPRELDGRLLTASRFRAGEAARLAPRTPDVVHRIRLTGGMGAYDWALNGRKFDMNDPAAHPFTVRAGQRVRLELSNGTDMWHPMHLHGHTFQLGADGPRKDTAIVLPGRTVACDFDADNPGQWLIHCHNAYHGEAGMMGLLGYLR
ncbi:multicopper oxidase family protein [Streptacidiphilus pinicola]|uniref:Multicopper oxidase family protein n=1 Tax=Streptacidiphilus pinicola TaxID=2219663 RepID=A0A2X0IAN4_9ACTN|nr:multicopper oxidase family protein [Streptacidiphilus pinicola]RAG81577.1 multicopper oxidase family protein [Streptacidiphilus pinicola]